MVTDCPICKTKGSVLVRTAGDKKAIHLPIKEMDCFDFAEVYNFNKERPMDMFVFTGLIWKENTEYSALCPELDVASQGSTRKAARQKLLEAATLHLEGSFEDGLPYLRPVPAAEDPRNSLTSEKVDVFKFKVNVAIKAYA
jgi:predicted RNase H-like HicB family nuclease